MPTPKKNEKCCEEKINQLIENSKSPFTKDNLEMLQSQKEATIDGWLEFYKSLEPSDPPPPVKPEKKVNEGEEGKETQPAEDPVKSYLEKAPAQIQDVLTHALNVANKQRKEMVQKVMTSPSNSFSEEQLNSMDISMLEGIAALLPKENKEGEDGKEKESTESRLLNYLGGAGNSPRANEGEEETFLETPKMDFSEK